MHFSEILRVMGFSQFLGFCQRNGHDPFVVAPNHHAMLQEGVLQEMMNSTAIKSHSQVASLTDEKQESRKATEGR